MKTYQFEPKKNNSIKFLIIFSLVGLVFICTQVGFYLSIFAICAYIIFSTIIIIEYLNIKNSRFELHENKLDHYIKAKLVRSFDLTNDIITINTFDHGKVLVIRQKKKKYEFHENNLGIENFDNLIFDLTGNKLEKKFTDFT